MSCTDFYVLTLFIFIKDAEFSRASRTRAWLKNFCDRLHRALVSSRDAHPSFFRLISISCTIEQPEPNDSYKLIAILRGWFGSRSSTESMEHAKRQYT